MAITYPRSVPRTTDIRKMKMMSGNVVAITESIFTKEQQIQKHQGEWWEAEITLVPMKQAKAQEWISWLNSLQGPRYTFLIGDVLAYTPQGSASTSPGTPVVRGGSQTGTSLDIDGIPSLVTDYLKAGDYISIGSGTATRLHQVMEDVNTESGGAATLELWPQINTAPSDNDPVTVSNATGAFRLRDKMQSWELEPSGTYSSITFKAVSVVG